MVKNLSEDKITERYLIEPPRSALSPMLEWKCFQSNYFDSVLGLSLFNTAAVEMDDWTHDCTDDEVADVIYKIYKYNSETDDKTKRFYNVSIYKFIH